MTEEGVRPVTSANVTTHNGCVRRTKDERKAAQSKEMDGDEAEQWVCGRGEKNGQRGPAKTVLLRV